MNKVQTKIKVSSASVCDNLEKKQRSTIKCLSWGEEKNASWPNCTYSESVYMLETLVLKVLIWFGSLRSFCFAHKTKDGLKSPLATAIHWKVCLEIFSLPRHFKHSDIQRSTWTNCWCCFEFHAFFLSSYCKSTFGSTVG